VKTKFEIERELAVKRIQNKRWHTKVKKNRRKFEARRRGDDEPLPISPVLRNVLTSDEDT